MIENTERGDILHTVSRSWLKTKISVILCKKKRKEKETAWQKMMQTCFLSLFFKKNNNLILLLDNANVWTHLCKTFVIKGKMEMIVTDGFSPWKSWKKKYAGHVASGSCRATQITDSFRSVLPISFCNDFQRTLLHWAEEWVWIEANTS